MAQQMIVIGSIGATYEFTSERVENEKIMLDLSAVKIFFIRFHVLRLLDIDLTV